MNMAYDEIPARVYVRPVCCGNNHIQNTFELLSNVVNMRTKALQLPSAVGCSYERLSPANFTSNTTGQHENVIKRIEIHIQSLAYSILIANRKQSLESKTE